MFGTEIMYDAWFAGEANVSDTFPTRNEFGFRNISDLNGSLATEVWAPLSVAAQSSKVLLDLTLPTPATNINLARAATFRGFSVLAMASDFCTGTLALGPELTTSQMLDTAIFWFSKAIDVGNANGTTDGKALANASLVGRARAKLQKGDKAGAATDATAVPAGFNFNMIYQDDRANRARLSNLVWDYTFERGRSRGRGVSGHRSASAVAGSHAAQAAAAGRRARRVLHPAEVPGVRLAHPAGIEARGGLHRRRGR